MSQGTESSQRRISYRDAGVDIDATDLAKRRITDLVTGTYSQAVLRGLGHFGGFFAAPGDDNSQVLVGSADSVGTKVLVANLAGSHENIGMDLVNHCVNDILACGARPLFFLDYFAAADLDIAMFESIVRGMTAACRDAACALIGGETAQLPGVYTGGSYDLAGFIVGSVNRDAIIDGAAIHAGDLLVGLPSSGLHTNGYSLARAALGLTGEEATGRERLAAVPDWSDRSLGELLLEPHRCYLRQVEPLLDKGGIRGMAHITGGGLCGNVSRIIPNGLTAVIDVGSWEVPPLFRMIQQAGEVPDHEMYRVFNMGIGYVLVVDPAGAEPVMRLDGAHLIGTLRAGTGDTRTELIGFEHPA